MSDTPPFPTTRLRRLRHVRHIGALTPRRRPLLCYLFARVLLRLLRRKVRFEPLPSLLPLIQLCVLLQHAEELLLPLIQLPLVHRR